MDKSIIRNIAGCYQNRDSSHTFFVGIISSTKNFKKLPLVESLFNISQEKEITQKGNNVLKFCKLHKMRNCPFFSNAAALQSRISDLNKYRLKKNISFECFEIVGRLQEKGL